jgi:uncharacterized membrane protein
VSTGQWILTYALTVPVFFAIDLVWLGVIARNFYRSGIGHLMADSPNWGIAIFFYLLYIVGILIFATRPALNSQSWTDALMYGALFGFFAYMTYDLTNLSTLRDWPVSIALVDMVWGAVLTGTVAVASYFIGRWVS